METLYGPATVDLAVGAFLAVGGLILLVLVLRALLDQFRSEVPQRPDVKKEVLTTGLVLLSVFVAYATMRNQLRMSAETAINDEGSNIFNLEMNDENLRCVYGNYAWDNSTRCLIANTSNPVVWSKIEFYVEESLFTLHKAGKDRDVWGSHYYNDVEYWAQDVEQDPTGLFSYYAISRYGLSGGKKYLSESRLCITQICSKYDRVYNILSIRDKTFAATNPRLCPPPPHRDRAMGECTQRPLHKLWTN